MGNFSDEERMANGTELLELAEEFDDARQEAEAEEAQATLEKQIGRASCRERV